MLLSRLPKLFQENPLMRTLARLLQDKKILFSSIVYINQGKSYIIAKNQYTPYFQKDWQAYSFMRCMVNSIVTSGSLLRLQKDFYKSFFTCGDQNISQMYQNFRDASKQKQNIYVMTKSMTRQEILPYFNTEIYDVLEPSQIIQQKEEKTTLKQVLQNLIDKCYEPILVECGPIVLKQYFDRIKEQNSQTVIDGVYLGFFQGILPKQSIGHEFQFQYDLYDIIWESQKQQILNAGQVIGRVHFKVYARKQK